MFAQFLADTGQFYHDPNNIYGENLAFNAGDGVRSTENILSREWYKGSWTTHDSYFFTRLISICLFI